MDILIHNTLSGKKEIFTPLSKGKVSMYHCGPTVYDTAHIGNLRTFVMNDTIRRVFEYRGYFVTQVMNITDVDDKTIKKSVTEKTTLTELTRRYESLFLEDIQSLHILTPHRLMRATEHVDGMIDMIATLLEHGFAYPSKDGVYMSIGKVKNYGALAKLKIDPTSSEHLRERITNDEYEKENPRDFALWKFYTPDDGPETLGVGGAVWDAPFGKGRPGWHIECSAMAQTALGDTIDIHTGGTDLIFPHHTNEIAQSESATGKLFTRYWIHCAFMNVNDAKMSKSKGNFLKLADLEAETISPLGFRYWLLTSHYRSQVNFSIEAVKAAQSAFIRLIEIFIGWNGSEKDGKESAKEATGKIAPTYAERFTKAVSDDFNTPEAVATIWELVKDKAVSPADKRTTVLDFDRVLGLGFDEIVGVKNTDTALAHSDIPHEILALAEARHEAREAKDWKKADALRAEIEERGYTVQDASDTSKRFLIRES